MLTLLALGVIFLYLIAMTSGIVLIAALIIIPLALLGSWLTDVEKDKDNWEDKQGGEK